MASFTPPRTRTLELETRTLSHAVALAEWIPFVDFLYRSTITSPILVKCNLTGSTNLKKE